MAKTPKCGVLANGPFSHKPLQGPKACPMTRTPTNDPPKARKAESHDPHPHHNSTRPWCPPCGLHPFQAPVGSCPAFVGNQFYSILQLPTGDIFYSFYRGFHSCKTPVKTATTVPGHYKISKQNHHAISSHAAVPS